MSVMSKQFKSGFVVIYQRLIIFAIRDGIPQTLRPNNKKVKNIYTYVFTHVEAYFPTWGGGRLLRRMSEAQ